MLSETYALLANFIWSICSLPLGPYKRNGYRKVILPLTVLRRFDCLPCPTMVTLGTDRFPVIIKGLTI